MSANGDRVIEALRDAVAHAREGFLIGDGGGGCIEGYGGLPKREGWPGIEGHGGLK